MGKGIPSGGTAQAKAVQESARGRAGHSGNGVGMTGQRGVGPSSGTGLED